MIAAQCKMARAALGLGVRELAELAKVSPDTIARLERGEELRKRTVDAVRAAFEAAGLVFTNGDQPGVRFRSLRIVVDDRNGERGLRIEDGYPGASPLRLSDKEATEEASRAEERGDMRLAKQLRIMSQAPSQRRPPGTTPAGGAPTIAPDDLNASNDE